MCPKCGGDAFENDRIKYRGDWVNQCVACGEFILYSDETEKAVPYKPGKQMRAIEQARGKVKSDTKSGRQPEFVDLGR